MPSQLVQDIAPILEEMAAMFANDEPKRAEGARHLCRIAIDRPEQVAQVYCSVDWWGGSGSMADFSPPDKGVNRRYLQLLAALVRAFERAGYDCSRAKSWAEIFEMWLSRGTI
jgi:hypothetical protein